jgi:Phage tail assembly chaperone protein
VSTPPERVVVNVEAQLARRLADEAEVADQQVAEVREQMVATLEQIEQADDPIVRARAQARIQDLVTQEAALMRTAEGARQTARSAVERALSLDDEADPATLDPVRRERLTAEELAANDADALQDRWSKLRSQRDALLRDSDWTQLPDAGVADTAAWATYRQKLRDLPAATPDPGRPRWPTPPS